MSLVSQSFQWTPNPDGTVDGSYPAGNKPPAVSALAWDIGTGLTDAGIEAMETGSTFTHDVRQYLSGTDAAVATITFVYVSGDDPTTNGWTAPGAGDDIVYDGVAAKSGVFRLLASGPSGNVQSANKSWACTTPASSPRIGIIYTMDFSQFSADETNPAKSNFFVKNGTTVTNSLNFNAQKHIAQAEWNTTPRYTAWADITALPHLEIVSSNPTPPNGGRCAKMTLYKTAIDYRSGGFQSNDKPRVDYYLDSVYSASDGVEMLRAAEYWMGMAIWLPSDYVGDVSSTNAPMQETIWQLHSPAGGAAANNHAEFGIYAGLSGTGAANWQTRCNANSDSERFSLRSNLSSAQRGAWTYHVWNFYIDPVTASNAKMHYWITQSGQANITPTWTKANNVGTIYGTTADSYIQPSVNYYKGGWRDDGTYTGIKTGSTTIAIADFRIGNAGSNYASVHPLGWAQP